MLLAHPGTLPRRPEGQGVTQPSELPQQIAVGAVKLTPPAAVSAYAALSNGLPFVISLLTLAYLAFQIAHGLWTWRNEWVRKREIDQQMKGRVAGYKEKAPK